jgi:hypothetical protein
MNLWSIRPHFLLKIDVTAVALTSAAFLLPNTQDQPATPFCFVPALAWFLAMIRGTKLSLVRLPQHPFAEAVNPSDWGPSDKLRRFRCRMAGTRFRQIRSIWRH